MRFPKFLRFHQKIQVERNFLTYFWQVLAFRLPSYKQTKKNITWLWGAPRSQPLKIASRNQSQKIFWSKNYKISRGQQFSSYRKEGFSQWKLGGFWPFLTPCAQTWPARGPHPWSSVVPLGGYQMTHQWWWWGPAFQIYRPKTKRIVKGGKILNRELFRNGRIFCQKAS